MHHEQATTSWPVIEAKLRGDGAPQRFIAAVCRRVEQVATGELGLIPESVIEPVVDLPTINSTAATFGKTALARTVVIKLNGGLATSMGLDQPKSLLPVRGDKTFLDLVITQLEQLAHPPRLVLFNSFATEEATRRFFEASVAKFSLTSGVPEFEHSRGFKNLVTPSGKTSEVSGSLTSEVGEFLGQSSHYQIQIETVLQHREPKLGVTTLAPIDWPADPTKEWCPPGHGDLYLALETSGILKRLLDEGIEYAFVSNIDNLGATLDPAILGMMDRDRIPFLMEVAERTPTDAKGGHLAQTSDGQLILRELAQCPSADHEAFQDVVRHRFFNTNSLWLHLPSMAALLATGDALTDLPLIVNRKTVDPADPTSPAVIQLETAMGSAISAISGARAIAVPRQRFAPVKTTNELLIRRSDAYKLTSAGELTLTESRTKPPHVVLGPAYKLLADFERRFPHGAPSLRECDELIIDGDVAFGANVVIRGSVHLKPTQPRTIPDGTVLEG